MSEPLPRGRTLRLLPGAHALVALAVGGIVMAIALGRGLTDPDYFWHVTTGELIARMGAVPSTDPFSFTWQGMPWTPHEWLSELLMFALVSTFGETATLAIFSALPAVTLVILAGLLAKLGVRTLAQAPVLALVGLMTAPYLTVRPQAISWLLLASLVRFLASASAESPRRLLWIGPLFVLWANLHGLYVIGIGVVVAYALFSLIGKTPMAPRRGWAIGAVGLAIAGAMATPAGPLGVMYPLRYSQQWGLEHIQEWQSPNFHDPAHWPLLIVLLALILNGGRRSPGWMQAVAYVATVMALVALRNVPVAAVAVAPVLGVGLEARLREVRGVHRPAPARAALARRAMELAAVGVVVVGAFAVFGNGEFQAPQDYPSAAVERLGQVAPEARVVAEYGWGGYVIHELFDDGGRVFVDGRNDMYAEAVLEDYTTIALGDPGWEGIVDRYSVDALLFPPSRPIAKGIAQAAGWCEEYRDKFQVLLRRECS